MKGSNWTCACGKVVFLPENQAAWACNKRRKYCGQGCPLLSKVRTDTRPGLSHGMRKHPAYNVWSLMKQRCQNPKDKGFKDWGGRGIRVCLRWQTFTNFWEDMGATYVEGLTLDRRNNNGNYCKSNCHWITARAQMWNTRANPAPKKWADLAASNGIKNNTFRWRIRHGYPLTEAATKAPYGL